MNYEIECNSFLPSVDLFSESGTLNSSSLLELEPASVLASVLASPLAVVRNFLT